MTLPSLPAELSAALEIKLHGLSRNDAAGRAAAISQAYRGGGNSTAIRTEVRRACLRAGANAGDLRRRNRKPERVARGAL